MRIASLIIASFVWGHGWICELSGPVSKELRSGACFSKVPKLFGLISGDKILYLSAKRRRFEARNFAVVFIFIPFTTYEKSSFTE